MTLRRFAFAALAALSITACATGGGGTGAEPLPSPQGREGITWPTRTREHVDLWLHGFAMLQRDTARVPFFSPRYREEVAAYKRSQSISTMLDANTEQLRARFAVNRNLESAQFLALYFGSWESMREAIQIFLQVEGDPRRVSNQTTQQIVAFFAAYFPLALDRQWLGLFTRAMEDERQRYYGSFWAQAQRNRAPARERLDMVWASTYLPKLRGYLDRTGQGSGDFLLSLPLDGEGRTITGSTVSVGPRLNIIATTYPETEAEVVNAVYVFAHEASGAVSAGVVRDNTTPAERREGLEARYQSNALVRGGELLLEKVAPELVDGYARYYLQAAGMSVSSNPRTALASAFPLPPQIVEGLRRQLDIVLGGI